MRTDTTADKPLILVIEDEEAINEGVCEILAHHGYSVLSAMDGEQGLVMIQEFEPDLVLCDIMMPKMDGFTLLQKLRSDDRYLTLPFIFLTAKSQAEDILEGLKTGADDFLPKPFDTKELIQAVDFRLQKHKQLMEKSRDEGKKHYLELAGRSSHEMGNILNGLLNGVEILLDDLKNNNMDDIDMILGLIKRAGVDLYVRYYNLEIVHSINTGYYFRSSDPSSTCLVETNFVRDLLNDVAHQYSNRIGDVKWDIMSERVGISADHLIKVLSEILLNAIQYSKPGEDIRIIGHPVNGAYKISVIDTGRGMDTKKLDYTKIFRDGDITSSQQFGMGLGLYIVHQILDFWGGSMSLYSDTGKGTLTIITLPIAERKGSAN